MPDYLWIDPDALPSGWDNRFSPDVKYIRADIVQAALFGETVSLKKLKETLEASE